ncbi:MAG: F420H2:quinone oxidoreductase subunit L [Candidatus Syntrophoarchaeum caldarius]|uniref:F420H2:quinone oxidoreductase subunit L n=1 Tax=Candidatus Syntropharchaeum caldarium TaxID=1838285 RepID=A0A1F2PBQ0_9EURY|nr:MAG: F420H2:quinone oxidoreductase subunit L [Candidatus Syntrophoarchaeum caldarius]
MAWIEYAYWIALLPLIGFVLELFVGKYTWKRGGIFANLAILGSTIIAIGTLTEVLGGARIDVSVSWFFDGIVVGYLIDPLAIVMLCMVSFVSLMIHIYATAYMDEDPNKSLYFAETALFTCGMLGLVLSNNLLQLFIFWELVGVCSYLLIGFWWYKPEAAAAGKKAFLTTRVGDVLFLLGIILLYFNVSHLPEPLSFKYLFSLEVLEAIPHTHLTAIALLFLGGAVGKSSQFPLHVWIPDAMEGPTTVSALIHAATMVTAGIYLVARTYPIFIASPDALVVVAVLGGFTALFAATLGLVVNDIKRVLAYSTISQLGYMLCMLGVGSIIGAFAVGYSLFHLISHAFFKALLFLCSGAVLHGLANTRDLREMGGLLKKMPVTAIAMLIGALSLSGFPLTAGFFSKDRIIETAYEYGVATNNFLPWIFILLAALLTAVYTFRLWFMAFTGEPRSYLAEHAHEASKIMTIPLIVLAAFALFFGIFQKKFYTFVGANFDSHLIEELAHIGGYHFHHAGHVPFVVMILPAVCAIGGIAIAYGIWYNNRVDVSTFISKENPIYRLLWNKYYLDFIFKDLIAERVFGFVALVAEAFDKYVIDGVVNGISYLVLTTGSRLRKIQTGVVETYATAVVIGVVILILLIGGVI